MITVVWLPPRSLACLPCMLNSGVVCGGLGFGSVHWSEARMRWGENGVQKYTSLISYLQTNSWRMILQEVFCHVYRWNILSWLEKSAEVRFAAAAPGWFVLGLQGPHCPVPSCNHCPNSKGSKQLTCHQRVWLLFLARNYISHCSRIDGYGCGEAK